MDDRWRQRGGVMVGARGGVTGGTNGRDDRWIKGEG